MAAGQNNALVVPPAHIDGPRATSASNWNKKKVVEGYISKSTARCSQKLI
jgi:hypothetical protein